MAQIENNERKTSGKDEIRIKTRKIQFGGILTLPAGLGRRLHPGHQHVLVHHDGAPYRAVSRHGGPTLVVHCRLPCRSASSLKAWQNKVKICQLEAIAPFRHWLFPLQNSTAILREATANLKLATATFELATANPKLATANPKLATANLKLATANLKLATANLELATANLELATANLELATANLELATANLELAIASLYKNSQNEGERGEFDPKLDKNEVLPSSHVKAGLRDVPKPSAVGATSL